MIKVVNFFGHYSLEVFYEGEVEDGQPHGKGKLTYEKSKEFLLAEGEVQIADIDGNILKTGRATYDKINEIITTHNYTELILTFEIL